MGNLLPLYRQVADDIRVSIRSHAWPPGSRMPTEAELTTMYGASRITIRQALDILSREGLIVKQPGLGTFVLEPLVTVGPRRLASFTEEIRQLGHIPSSRVLRQERILPPPDVAGRLGLPAQDHVIELERVRLGDGQPIGIQTAWLPARLFPGLEDADLAGVSLYDFLSETYGVVPSEAEETFVVTRADARTAKLLAVRRGACAFRVERITYAARQPIEFVSSVMRADIYRIQIRLHRDSTEYR
ncbi:MAG: GntR family transcriptional regulator [Candidatus Dormibacteraeota bacterium]|nr:GntR family transcriptional regulator [Candidatus Dormibacteraeota bacterium]